MSLGSFRRHFHKYSIFHSFFRHPSSASSLSLTVWVRDTSLFLSSLTVWVRDNAFSASLPQNGSEEAERHSVAMMAVPPATLARNLAGGVKRHWLRGYAAEGAAGGVVGNQRAFRGCWFPLAGHRALSGRGSWKPSALEGLVVSGIGL